LRKIVYAGLKVLLVEIDAKVVNIVKRETTVPSSQAPRPPPMTSPTNIIAVNELRDQHDDKLRQLRDQNS
jgi:hypothetical protein